MLVEAALGIPILLYVTFGLIEFGDYFYVKHSLMDAAHAGAMAASIGGASYSSVTSAVSSSITSASLANSGYTVQVQDNGTVVNTLSNVNAGDFITVTVSATWSTAANNCRPMGFISGSKVVTGTVVMRTEPTPQ